MLQLNLILLSSAIGRVTGMVLDATLTTGTSTLEIHPIEDNKQT